MPSRTALRPGSVAVTIHESADPDFRPEPRPAPGLATVPEQAPEPDPQPDVQADARPGLRPDSASDSAPLPDDLVTRLLSAHVYLHESFADRVNAELVHPSRAALPPLWQVDAVQLARHPAPARRNRPPRDLGLTASLGYALLAGTTVLAVAVGQILALRQALAIWVVLWIWAYIVSVRLVYAQALAARRSAVAVIYDPAAVVPDPLPRPSVEQGRADLDQSNVVLVRGVSPPFVGSRVNVDTRHLTSDLTK